MDRSKWEYKKLGDICTKLTDGSHNPPKGIDDSEYHMISSQNIFNDRIELSDYRCLSKEDFEAENKRTSLKKGDLLLTIVGAIGRCYVLNGTEGNLTLQRSVAALTPKDNVSSRFLMYYFIANNANLLEEAHGVAQKGIYLRQLSNLIVPIPAMDDQQRIVGELDCLNEMIALKQEQLKEFDKLAQSIFYDMFGDPSVNEKGWNMKPFAEIAFAKTGITYKPDNVKESGIIVLRSSNVQGDELAFEDVVRVDLPISEKYHVQNGDILMCSRNGSARLVGKTARIMNVNEIMTWGAFMTIIRSKFSDYLLQYFKTDAFRNSLASSKTTTVHQITIGMLNALNIPLPPLALQQQFAEKIQAIEAQKELVKKSIAETQHLLDSRMDYYFN